MTDESRQTDEPAAPGNIEDASTEAPYDKKRVALLNGACGQADRVRIAGQIVDIPITRSQIDEEWDILHNLPRSLRELIRPIQDFSMMSVRRPRLQIEILTATPKRYQNIAGEDADADTVDADGEDHGDRVIWSSGEIIAGDEGFFEVDPSAAAERLAPGDYVTRVILRGIHSVRQSVADLAYIGNSDSLILKQDMPIGYGRLRILPNEYDGRLLTSDIDQTFLNTPIHSTQGLMDTLFETPKEKTPITGLPEFYRQAQQEIPLLFISASPHFFRRTLSAVFDHHDIEFSGLHLKYLLSTFDNILKKITSSILNLNDVLSQGVSTSLERTLKFLGSSLASLFDHISYKLTTLLENRLMQPTNTREILMGDNKESDFFIFTLYQYLLLGELTGSALENYLYRLNFLDREALTRDAAKRIARLVERNLEVHGPVNSVEHVWINLSRNEPAFEEMEKLIAAALPGGLGPKYVDDDRVARPRPCRAGIGFGLAAFEAGIVDQPALFKILQGAEGGVYQEEILKRDDVVRMIKDFRFNGEAKLSPDEIVAQL